MTKRPFKTLLSSLFVVALTLVGSVPAHAAPPAAPAAEQQFFTMLNNERVTRGLPALVRDPQLDNLARAWSAQMAGENNLYHRPDLAVQIAAIEPKWQRGGENVGVGGTVESLHTAFMNSPGHYANIVGDWNRLGVGVVVQGSTIWVTFNFLKGPAITPVSATTYSDPGDVWIVTSNGEVRALGNAPFLGDVRSLTLNRPIVGMATTPSGHGYWLVASDGGIFAFGDAVFFGSTGALKLAQPVVGMASTPTGKGYWLVGADGGVFAFGDATFFGSMGGQKLNAAVNGIAGTPSGRGYRMVAADGGMFSFGDAQFLGSMGGSALPAPVNGVATTPSGNGYWLVGANGSVYAFGDAPSLGSANSGGVALSRIATTRDGLGYRMAAADGRIFLFGTAGSGSSAPMGLTHPVVALASPN